MSHYTVIRTRMVDPVALVAALGDLGFVDVEVHDEPQALVGYLGDTRAQRAEVIIRRTHVGEASNDIGFARQKDGSFEAIVSAFDRRSFDNDWLSGLTRRYAYHATKASLEREGFGLVSEEADVDGRVHLVLRRVV